MSEFRSMIGVFPPHAGLLDYVNKREWHVSRVGRLFLVLEYSPGHLLFTEEERRTKAFEILSAAETGLSTTVDILKGRVLSALRAERTGVFPSPFLQATLLNTNARAVDYWTSGGHVLLHCRADLTTVTVSADARGGTVMPRKRPAPLAETNLLDRFDTVATIDTEQWFRSGRIDLQAKEALLVASMGAEPEAIWSGPVPTNQLWTLESGWQHGMKADVLAIGDDLETLLPAGCLLQAV